MSWPASSTEPEFGRSSATTTRPMVVLPQPDSPTRPNVSPALTVNETSDTACTAGHPALQDRPGGDRELLDQVAHLEQRRSAGAAPSWASGRPGGAGGRVGDGLRAGAVPSAAPAPAGPSTGCQQENRCARVSPVSGGSSVRHRSVARLHRGANRQPGGGLARSGGSPPMVSSRCVLVLAQPRDGGQQRLGVRVAHVPEQVAGLGGLDHPARVHHLDPVRVPGDHAHVVRDQQHRHAEAVLEARAAGRGSAPGW